MTVFDMYNQMTGGELAGWALVIIIILMSLIQIAPVRLNPWDSFFAWIGKKMNGRIEANLNDLWNKTKDIWINQHRQSILNFARECRNGVNHSTEEWNYILNICGEYEDYCERNKVNNGVVHENTLYIRNLFHELSREHKI